jgi:hypothetical protein
MNGLVVIQIKNRNVDTQNGLNTNAGVQYSNKWGEKHSLNLSPKYNRQSYQNNNSSKYTE